MLINILLGLIFLALIIYLILQLLGRRKSPRSIAAKELEQERRRRERRKENLRRIQEHVRFRTARLAEAVGEVADTMGDAANVSSETSDGMVYVQAGDASYSAVFRLPEYDLDAENLDVEAYADKYGKYVLEQEGERFEYESLDEIIRHLARELAKSAGV